MANYTVELPISLCGSVHEDVPNQELRPGFDVSDLHGSSTLMKFNTDSLNSYKKKKISSMYIKSGYISTNRYMMLKTAYVGGLFSFLSNTFTTSTTYNTIPQSTGVFYKYISNTGTGDYFQFPWTYYQAGDTGYKGQTVARSLYDQLPIGIKFSNDVSNEERVAIDWDSDSTNWRFVFQFEDFNLVRPSFPTSNAFVYAPISNIFSIGFDQFTAIEYPTVTQAAIEIKDVATSEVTPLNISLSINIKGITSIPVTIPANIMAKNKNYQWRAKLITNDGETSFSDWAYFTTSDSIPNAPLISFPNSAYLDASQAIELAWAHNVSTGSTQYAYDVDYKQSGDWVSFANHVVSSNNKTSIPEDTLTSGNFTWRARTYNTDDAAGPYGESTLNIVIAKPETPIIQTLSTTPRVTVSWQSIGQEAYELWIDGQKYYDYGADRSYTINDYLPDGFYPVKLRVQNAQGVWSEYAQQTISVKNVPLFGDDILSAEQIPGGLKFVVSLPKPKGEKYVGEVYAGEAYAVHEPSFAAGDAYILRDGEPIAKVTDNYYVDYTSAGVHSYVYRVVNNGYYRDTNIVTTSPDIKYSLISKLSAPQNFLALTYKKGEKPTFQNSLDKTINTKVFTGRALPVYDVTEHHNSSWNFSYSFKNPSDYVLLKQLFLDGEPVLLRDGKGYTVTGILESLTPTIERNIITANFTIKESNASEVIEYV